MDIFFSKKKPPIPAGGAVEGLHRGAIIAGIMVVLVGGICVEGKGEGDDDAASLSTRATPERSSISTRVSRRGRGEVGAGTEGLVSVGVGSDCSGNVVCSR